MKKLLKNLLSPIHNFIYSKNIRTFLKLYLRFSNAKRFKETKINFLNYFFIVPDSLSFVYQFKEIFVDQIYKFKNVSDEPIIYDCGANVGTSILYFKKNYPNAIIKAFEPDKKIFSYLKNNLIDNGINNVLLENNAVWINNDGISFSSDGADGGSMFGADNVTLVSSVRLRDLLSKEKLVDMLKMDIEGSEVEVIMDCVDVLDKVNNLFVEYHSWSKQPQKLDELLQVLSKAGFRYYLQTIKIQSEPFVNKGSGMLMDLQLNISAYRI
ncbi:MAG: FkbM family methyltransferase [Candidatus Magasanikbacteria bacterium]